MGFTEHTLSVALMSDLRLYKIWRNCSLSELTGRFIIGLLPTIFYYVWKSYTSLSCLATYIHSSCQTVHYEHFGNYLCVHKKEMYIIKEAKSSVLLHTWATIFPMCSWKSILYFVLWQSAVKMFSQSVEICHQMEVPAKALKVSCSSGEVEINPPSVHIGYKPISLLLISYRWRGSQVGIVHVRKYLLDRGIFRFMIISLQNMLPHMV